MHTEYRFSYTDAQGNAKDSDKAYLSVHDACVGAVKRLCLSMSEHEELRRAQGVELSGDRIDQTGVCSVSICVVPEDTWTNRALACVRAQIEACRDLQRGLYLTLEERTLWATEAKRLVGVKERLISRGHAR